MGGHHVTTTDLSKRMFTDENNSNENPLNKLRHFTVNQQLAMEHQLRISMAPFTLKYGNMRFISVAAYGTRGVTQFTAMTKSFCDKDQPSLDI